MRGFISNGSRFLCVVSIAGAPRSTSSFVRLLCASRVNTCGGRRTIIDQQPPQQMFLFSLNSHSFCSQLGGRVCQINSKQKLVGFCIHTQSSYRLFWVFCWYCILYINLVATFLRACLLLLGSRLDSDGATIIVFLCRSYRGGITHSSRRLGVLSTYLRTNFILRRVFVETWVARSQPTCLGGS